MSREELIEAAVAAAREWSRGQGWTTPLDRLTGQVAAAVDHLLDAGLLVPAAPPYRPHNDRED